MDRKFARNYGVDKMNIQDSKIFCKNNARKVRKTAKRLTRRSRRRLEARIIRDAI